MTTSKGWGHELRLRLRLCRACRTAEFDWAKQVQEIPEFGLDETPPESASEGSQQPSPQPSLRVCEGNGNKGGSKKNWARRL